MQALHIGAFLAVLACAARSGGHGNATRNVETNKNILSTHNGRLVIEPSRRHAFQSANSKRISIR
jgi:hypothetical protein